MMLGNAGRASTANHAAAGAGRRIGGERKTERRPFPTDTIVGFHGVVSNAV